VRGSVNQATTVRLTPLSGQDLPGFLPLGWSPLKAFWLESSHQLQGPLETVLQPEGPIGAGEVAALVRWEESGLVWRVEQARCRAMGANAVRVDLPGAGAYALVVGDVG
jgi:hypothetical protein